MINRLQSCSALPQLVLLQHNSYTKHSGIVEQELTEWLWELEENICYEITFSRDVINYIHNVSKAQLTEHAFNKDNSGHTNMRKRLFQEVWVLYKEL